MMLNMSNTFYNLISNQVMEYFQHNPIRPGDKFHIQFEHPKDVELLYDSLKDLSNQKNIHQDFVWEIQEPYKTFFMVTPKAEVLIASSLDGVTPDFLTKLRNSVGTEEQGFQNKAILFIHNTTLDSITGGSINFQDSGMPLAQEEIENLILTSIHSAEIDEVTKSVISFSFNQIKERNDANTAYSIFEYADIIGALSNELKPESYPELGLFYDLELKSYPDHETREKRLKENYDLFKFVDETERYGDFGNELEKKFDEEGIKQIVNSDWRKLDFADLKNSHENLKKQIPPEYIEEIKKQTNERLTYWERPEGTSKSKGRKRHIIVFNPEAAPSISLELQFNDFLSKANLKNRVGESASISGKKIKVIYTHTPSTVEFLSFQYKDRGATYEFKIAIVPFKEEFFEDIRSRYLVDAKKSGSSIKILDFHDRILFNVNSTNNEVIFELDGNRHEFHASEDERVILQLQDDYFQNATDTQVLKLFVGNVEVAFSIPEEKVEIKKIKGIEISKLKREKQQNFIHLENKKLLFGNQQFELDDKLMIQDLKAEQALIEQKALALEYVNQEYRKKEIQIPEKLEEAYLNYIGYFHDNKLLPSLTYWDEVVQRLAMQLLDSYIDTLMSIEEGLALSDLQRDLTKLGSVESNDDLRSIKYMPVHPINLIYQFVLLKKVGGEEIPEEILQRLSSDFLVPYVYQDNKIFKAISQNHSPEWTYYHDYKVYRHNASSTFVSKLVSDKIKEFTEHYHFLFTLNPNSPLKINIINLGDCKEVLQGMFQYYSNQLKKKSKDELLRIDLTIYENQNVVNVFEELSFYDEISEIENQFGVKFHHDKYAPEEILNVFREKVRFYKKSYTDDQFDFCHISFFELDEDIDETSDQMEKMETGTSLGGLFSSLTSTYLGGSYRTGFGTRYTDYQENPLLHFVRSYNSLVLASGRQNTFESGKTIVTAFSNKGKGKLRNLYDASYWVTFIEPKFDLNFFSTEDAKDVLIIHYSDQYTPSSNYDAITVTQKSKQFRLIIEEMLADKSDNVNDETTKQTINLFNTINGDWLLRMIGSKSQFPREKLSILSAMKFVLSYLDHKDIIWVPLSLEEILRVSGAVGLKQNDSLFSAKQLGSTGSHSDDLLLMGFENTEKEVKIHLYTVEVKIGKNPTSVIEKALDQVSKTAKMLYENLTADSFRSAVYRDFLIQLAITNAKKMKIYGVMEEQAWDVLLSDEIQLKLLNESYKITNELDQHIGKGTVVSFKKDNYFRTVEILDNTLVMHLTENDGFEYLVLNHQELFTRIHQSKEGYPKETLLAHVYRLSDDNTVGTNRPNDPSHNKPSESTNINTTDGGNDHPPDPEDSSNVSPSTSEPLKILFGHSTSTNEPLYWYPTTTSKVMHTNTGIIGTMGTGKTQFTKAFVKQLYDSALYNVNGKPIDILIFDYKGDYVKEDFVNATNAKIHDPYHLPYNPLALYKGEKPKKLLPLHTASSIRDTISKAYGLGTKQQQLLLDIIMDAYKSSGIDKGNQTTWDLTPPTFNNVYQEFVKREEMKEDSLYAALKQIYDFEVFSPKSEGAQSLYDMIEGVTVIDLAGYDRSIQNLIVGITLDTFYSQMSTKGHSEIQGDFRELTKMILVDEADNFLSQNFTSLKLIMKEGREYGVGVTLSTQFLSHFATADNDYAQYILTWIVHRVPTIKKKEVQTIFSPETVMEGEQIANKIAQLPKHRSFVTSVSNKKFETMEDLAFWQLRDRVLM